MDHRVDARGATRRARRGHALVAGGADLNAAEPQYGFTAMQTAIFNGHYAFAKLLIEKGADVNDGSLYIVIEMRNLANTRTGPIHRTPRTASAIWMWRKLLLDKGADPNAAVHEDRSAAAGAGQHQRRAGLDGALSRGPRDRPGRR